MSQSKKLAALAGAALFALAGAQPASAQALRVVATFSIIGDLARQVGGDRIALTTLVGPDSDAHTYEPRPADLKAIGTADVILANGLDMEGFLPGLIQAGGAKVPITALTDGVELRLNQGGSESPAHAHKAHDHEEHHHEEHHHAGQDAAHEAGPGHAADSHDRAHAHHAHGKFDPHAWQTVPNARIYVGNIAKAFCAADRQGCPAYEAHARAYDEKLRALQTQIAENFARIPADRRTIIPPHDAFGYFAREYGFKFEAPQGMSTDSQASAAGLATLVKQVKDEKAAALFLENISNPRLVEQISSETGLKVGGKLYSDALSSADGPASTYIDMMRHNAATITDAILAR